MADFDVEQLPLLPVIVYTCVAEGLNTCVAPVKLPGAQVYDVAPLAAAVADWPEHKVEEDKLTFMVGVWLTVIVVVADELNDPQLPLTVYTVLETGIIERVGDCILPGNHV